MNEENSLYWDCIDKWGMLAQVHILIEEMAELTQVILKRDRAHNGSTDAQVAEEIADVDICLSQMKLVWPTWEEHRERKLERLRKRVYQEAEG